MDLQTYQALTKKAQQNSLQFWADEADNLQWIEPWHTVLSGDFDTGNICWFEGGQLNVCVNCVDRHLASHAEKPALIWEGDDPRKSKIISFHKLYEEVCRFANVLKSRGVKKGDRVCLYMPMIPETIYAMLACARIGAVHSVVFGGFSAEALKNRIEDAQSCAIITVDIAYRGGKALHFKQTVDRAISECTNIHTVLVVSSLTYKVNNSKEVDYSSLAATMPVHCPAEPMQSEDPLFILYTSGSTGKPKGVLHTSAGYLLYAAFTHRVAFDIQPDDVYWCTADVGWITGHSYVVYGPLANATTLVIHEGTPIYPTPARHWEIIDKHRVSIYYTSPTSIRMLMSFGEEPLHTSCRKSLRVLGSVGEPINPEAWHWFFEKVGHQRCAIIDTWWQTETGGFMIIPPNEVGKQKPSAAMKAFPGTSPILLNEQLQEIEGQGEGALVFKQPWPGMLRTVFGHHQRFIDTYLKPCPSYFYTGDEARRDSDGDLWILGRMDDILNVSGHRLGTAELENALSLHHDVSEVAIVSKPDEVKGESIVAFITLRADIQPTSALEQALKKLVREQIGPIATIEHFIWVSDLPKTRSGKIMRRILRELVRGQRKTFGDTSTLANPECISQLVKLYETYSS